VVAKSPMKKCGLKYVSFSDAKTSMKMYCPLVASGYVSDKRSVVKS